MSNVIYLCRRDQMPTPMFFQRNGQIYMEARPGAIVALSERDAINQLILIADRMERARRQQAVHQFDALSEEARQLLEARFAAKSWRAANLTALTSEVS